MLWYVILGFLRGGGQRHGYELATEYRARSGTRMSVGGFYRELTRLAAAGLVETGVNPPGADTRRIPYCITERGRQEFDRWLLAPTGDAFTAWLLFLDRVPRSALRRVLDRRQDDLLLRKKLLTRAGEDTPNGGGGDCHPSSLLLSRQLKQLAAELEFLEEVRARLDGGAGTQAGRRDATVARLKGRRAAAS